jgi:hypothetical protein
MEKEIIAKIIVDLYEMRVSTMHRYQEKYEKVQDTFKYSFFTAAIAQIYDKYKIQQELIEEEIRSRQLKSNIETSPL